MADTAVPTSCPKRAGDTVQGLSAVKLFLVQDGNALATAEYLTYRAEKQAAGQGFLGPLRWHRSQDPRTGAAAGAEAMATAAAPLHRQWQQHPWPRRRAARQQRQQSLHHQAARGHCHRQRGWTWQQMPTAKGAEDSSGDSKVLAEPQATAVSTSKAASLTARACARG